MRDLKTLFLNEDLRSGGFYELSIQVCPSVDNTPIQLYTDYIWNLKNVEGPFDNKFNKIHPNVGNFQHDGILHLDNFSIPFRTYNIREDEPIETGFNWFDVYFATAAIEKVFGEEYQVWTETPKAPIEITKFFNETVEKLYQIYPFKMAMVDFEVSGQYYLDNLQKPFFENYAHASFFVGKNNYDQVCIENRKFVKQIG